MEGKDYEVTRSVPVGDVWTVLSVLVLAVGVGLVVLLALGLLALGWRWSVKWVLTGAGGASLLVLVLALARLERAWFQTDTVSPVATDEPGPVPVVQVELHDVERGRWAFAELPGTPEQLQRLAAGVLNGQTLAEGGWTGQGALFRQKDFRRLRGELLERGLVVWRVPGSPGQGVELTRGGLVLFQQLAELDVRGGACAGTGSVKELTDGSGRGAGL